MSTPAGTDRGRATRQRIVDAAAELFHARGVAATGLNEVIARSGTGKGQLYHYFTGKPDLVVAVAAEQAARVLAAQRDLLTTMGGGADLRAWAAAAAAVHEGGGPVRCPLGALVLELDASQPALRQGLDAGFEAWRSALASALTRLQAAGHVRADREAADLAEVLLAAYEGGVVLSEVRGSTRPLRLSLDSAVEALLTAAGAQDP